jgi:antitoxin component HigA of HigAB toxin-antitoxin module
MNVHPIRTEADYDTALGEVERLWGSKAGTLDGDRLDVLIVLVATSAPPATRHAQRTRQTGAHVAKRKTRAAPARR